MDALQHIITRMKRDEIRAFKMFAKKAGRSDERRLTQLFDLLRIYNIDTELPKILINLFPNAANNKNAYYRLKNRLKNEIESYLLATHSDLDERVVTINIITLASIFAYKSEYELSLSYLHKAEKIAHNNEYYELLDLIYNQIIALGHMFDDINPAEYLTKLNEARKRNAVLQEANLAIASVSYMLRRTNFNKQGEDMHAKLQKIYDHLKLSGEITQSPVMRFKMYQLVRDTLLHSKDMLNLELYLVKTLKTFEDDELFTKANHSQKIKMISWIVNAMTINKNWEEALIYSQKLHGELLKFNKLYYDNFIWTYYQAMVTNYMSTNHLDIAIELLEQIKELPSHKGQMFYDYAIHINLCLCYYFCEMITQSIRTLSYILVKELYPRLTPELQYSVSSMEVLLHFENKDYEFVTYKIAEIKRQFKKMLHLPENEEEVLFLKVVNSMANKPNTTKDKGQRGLINDFMAKAPDTEVGSGRHIDYKLWVRSKLERRPYYELLLEALKKNPI